MLLGMLRMTLLLVPLSVAAQPWFDVKAFGAKGDGKTLETAAINRAVEACSAAGGGTVYVPAGTYLTGTIHLKSHVNLWVDAGATILGSKDLTHYRWPRGERDWYAALILGEDVENVALTGPGTINGNQVFNPKGEERMRGPHAFVCYRCRDVTIRDIHFLDAANYAVRLNSCERVNIRGVTARGGWDGINMWDTRNVTISDCRLFTGDDCLAGAYWENVTVTNCVLNTSCNAFRVGGRRVLVDNVIIYGPGQYEHRTSARRNLESGFQILPHRRAFAALPSRRLVAEGPVDDIVLSNVTMHNVRSPVWIAFAPDAPYSRDNLGVGRILIQNLTVTGAGMTPFYVAGPVERPARSIVLRNIRMTFQGGGTEAMADGQGFSPYSILQAYGFYFRNVERVEMHDVRIDYREKDLRPALFGQNLGTLELDRFQAAREPDGAPMLVFDRIGKLLHDGVEAGLSRAAAHSIAVGSPTIRAGERFSLVVEGEPVRRPGLVEFPVMLGSQSVARTAWLETGSPARVRFVNLVAPAEGPLELRSGAATTRTTVQPRPQGRPVAPPYKSFSNIRAVVEQLDDGFYVRASGDAAILDRADQYGAVYLEDALPERGEAVVKVENPELATGWSGRMGIMVRNDISKPGEARGYLILACSPANGPALEWDSDGDGRIDQRTELDGYTYWPHWLRLVRSGAEFTGFWSADGRNWQKIGTATALEPDAKLDAGVFTHLRAARFREFRVTAGQ